MANPALTKSFKTAVAEQQGGFNGNMVAEPPMTVAGTAGKALLMLGVVIVSAFVTAFITIMNAQSIGSALTVAMVASLAALGVAIWVSLSKTVQKAGMFIYALLEGILVGVLSLVFEVQYPGIVLQAVFATFATAGLIFVAWRLGWIKVNDKFMKFLMFGLFAYIGLSLVNILLAVFTGFNVFATEFGWIAGLIGCTLAAFSLAADFQIINAGAEAKLTRENEWRGAFGLTVTLIWLYLEILRLLAIARR